MANSDNSNSAVTGLQAAQVEIERLRSRVAELEASPAAGQIQGEPIAIVGMGCRFPGNVSTPEAFWDLLESGRDVLRDIPSSRWDVDAYYDQEVSVPGKMYVRQGHYLDDIDQFDPQFFGLSPREAASLDPQQRLIMEVSWEALEHAGIATSSLKGGKTGVFVGQYWDDYSMQRIYATELREIDRYAQLSGLRGLTAGRIAHILDSHGPAIQLDTACSSASLAVHLACQSLMRRESDLVLAGGVSLILAPEHLIGICQMKALSADGRCKTFDANADGFGQGEGAGMVALKRLEDAQADGDRILAVVHGSAANHDGHARTVTTPSGPAQRAMLQDALDNARLHPHQLSYVETHGTGTPLGDPIEVMAIARVLCQDRTDPLYLGSVKTNVGHLDAAAGIVGLMKVVLSLQHQTIPPHLNFSEPNSRIPWADWPLRIPTEPVPWEAEERIAGISAFGMSGTNVHLIVGEAPTVAVERPASPPPGTIISEHVLTLSAQNPATLSDLATSYSTHLDSIPDGPDELTSVCYTAAIGRTHFAHRISVIGATAAELSQSLTKFANGDTAADVVVGATGRRPPKLAFLFTGQGAQHVGMGRSLYEHHPTFRFWLDRCAELLEPELDKPLLGVMWEGVDLHQTIYTQPALFALEYSLAKLWEEWGVVPDLLMGHSIGEYAAACIANVFSLEDALRLVAARGRLMQSLPAGGEMVSVVADEATVAEAISSNTIAALAETVSIAAVNAPQSIVISGAPDAIQAAVAELHKQSIKTTALKVSHAFHSPLMEPILEAFRAVASQVDYHAPTTPVISNVTGHVLSSEQLNAEYWVQHLRGAVRFADAIGAANKQKIETFVEIGPRPTLTGLGRACVESGHGTWLASIKPNREWSTLLRSLAELHARGVDVAWSNFYRERPQKVVLPTYPWRRQRYWTDIVSAAAGPELHPLVHRRISNASTHVIFESKLSAANPSYLADHTVFENAVFPASAYFEMALTAGQIMFGHTALELSNLSIQRPMVLTATALPVQLVVSAADGEHRFEVFSKPQTSNTVDDDRWVRHAAGLIQTRLGHDSVSSDGVSMGAGVNHAQDGDSQVLDLSEFHERFVARGVSYGPAFNAITELRVTTDNSVTACAEIELPTEAVAAGSLSAYTFHPVVMDACLRCAEVLFPAADETEIYLPFAVSRLRLLAAPETSVTVRASGKQVDRTRIVNLEILDGAGQVVALIDELMLRAVSVFSLQQETTLAPSTKSAMTEWLYQPQWRPDGGEHNSDQTSALSPSVAAHGDAAGLWLILADAAADQRGDIDSGGQTGGLGRALAIQLESSGGQCIVAARGTRFRQVATNQYELDPTSIEDFGRLMSATLAETDAGSFAGVINLWSLDAQAHNYHELTAGTLHLVQSLQSISCNAPMWLVTRGAHFIDVADAQPLAVWQTSLWGFGRTLQVEYPNLSRICLDLDPDPTSQQDCVDSLLGELLHADGENQIGYRSTGGFCKRYVARLSRLELATDANNDFVVHGDASYLVTGGLGALGLKVAEFLVAAGARRLLLSGRNGVTTAEQETTLTHLRERGATIDVVAADVSSSTDVTRMLELAGPRLAGIIHAAGVLDDGMVVQQTPSRFQTVAGPKINGAWQLHEQTQTLTLDFFVMFSSVASIVGSAGQANYAAANAFMDGLAHYRRQLGLPALSINWGPWADVGMASSDTVLRRLMSDGWQPMSAQTGCEFVSLLSTRADVVQAGVIPLDWATFAARVPGVFANPYLSELVAPAATSTGAASSKVEAIAKQALDASSEARQQHVVRYLLERAAQTLRVPVADLDAEEALSSLGIDSLTAVELRSWIHIDLGVELPVEQMFTAPTIAELAAVVVAQLAGDGSKGPKPEPQLDDGSESIGQWVIQSLPRHSAQKRLFCFPYAGGGASAFRDWAALFPDYIEVCAIQFPGREERLHESALSDMTVLVGQLTRALLPYLDKPFAFFGHSMGAMVSFEVARHLRTLAQSEPEHLFLSARAAPQVEAFGEPLRLLPNSEFIERLHALYGAVPSAIQQSAELQAIFVPILKADVALLETHTFTESSPLNCPLTVLGGAQDPAITPTMLSAWREQTLADVAQLEFPGDHFYIAQSRDALIQAIVARLA